MSCWDSGNWLIDKVSLCSPDLSLISLPHLIFSSCIIYNTYEVCACTGANRTHSMQICHPASIRSNSLYILLHFLFSWTYLILFSFHLSVSFIIFPFVFFLCCFPSALVSVVAFFLLLCLSVSLRLSDLSGVKSSLHLDSHPLMGAGYGKTQDRKSAVYWGKSFSKSQKRLGKTAKAENTKHYIYVFK